MIIVFGLISKQFFFWGYFEGLNFNSTTHNAIVVLIGKGESITNFENYHSREVQKEIIQLLLKYIA